MNDYQKLLRALSNAGDVEIPMDPKFYDRLHAKIMSQVDEVEMKPSPLWMRSKKYLQSHWKSWFHGHEWEQQKLQSSETKKTLRAVN